ncbi:ABC transporter permease [Candidatus Woesearchaeota archaeon]|nr:ABC transporter permease [Candidatus Woesearchaeota archaeon]
MKLHVIIKKNFRLLLRSKSSALIVVLGPLLIIFLVGLAFDTSQTSAIKIGAYADSYTELTDSFIGALRGSDLMVIQYPSLDKCVDAIKMGQSHACVVFPADFEIRNDRQNEITFYIDRSRVNLVYLILDVLSSKVDVRASELTADMTTVLVEKLAFTEERLVNASPRLDAVDTDADDISGKQDIVSDKLTRLDLSFDEGDFGLDEVQDQAEGFLDAVDNIKDDALDAIDSALDDFEDLQSDIEGLGLNASVEEDLLDSINDSMEALISRRGSIEEIANDTDRANEAIADILDDIAERVEETAERFKAIAAARTQSIAQLSLTKERVEGIKAGIADVRARHQDVLASIRSTEVTDVVSIVSPITTRIEEVTIPQTHLNYMFPSIIVLIIMFISILLSSTLISIEKSSQAYFRNLITPTRDISFILGVYVTSLIILIIQIGIIIGISAYFFQSLVAENAATLALILFMLTTIFIFIGMMVGYFFKSDETTMLASVSIASVFLLVSDLIFPLESMPQNVLSVAIYNPFLLGADLVKKALLFGTPIELLKEDLYVLIAYMVIGFCLMFMVAIFSRKNLMKRQKKAPRTKYQTVQLSPKDFLAIDEKTRIKSLAELEKHLRTVDKKTFRESYDVQRHKICGWLKEHIKEKDLIRKMETETGLAAFLRHLKALEKNYQFSEDYEEADLGIEAKEAVPKPERKAADERKGDDGKDEGGPQEKEKAAPPKKRD